MAVQCMERKFEEARGLMTSCRLVTVTRSELP